MAARPGCPGLTAAIAVMNGQNLATPTWWRLDLDCYCMAQAARSWLLPPSTAKFWPPQSGSDQIWLLHSDRQNLAVVGERWPNLAALTCGGQI